MFYEPRLLNGMADARVVGAESESALNEVVSYSAPVLPLNEVLDALTIHLQKLLTALESEIPSANGSGSFTMLRDLARAFSAVLNIATDKMTLPDRTYAHPAPDGVRKLAFLTPRQHQTLELLVLGKSNKEIARLLKLGEGTVKVHVAALLHALGVENRARAAAVGANLLKHSDNKDIGTDWGDNSIRTDLRR